MSLKLKNRFLLCFLMYFIIYYSSISFAFSAEPSLDDSSQERRAISIFKSIRCMVCSGSSIYESDSEFARSLRDVVRDRIVNGNMDSDIINELTAIYGERIALNPKLYPYTFLLWFIPMIIMLSGIFLIFKTWFLVYKN